MTPFFKTIGMIILLAALLMGTACGGSASSTSTVLTETEEAVLQDALQDTITVLTAVVAIEGETLSVDRAERE